MEKMGAEGRDQENDKARKEEKEAEQRRAKDRK